MGVSRVSSLFAAAALAAGMSMVASPSAFADVQDCLQQAEGVGMGAPQAGTACGYAQGGDTEDCASMVRNDTGAVADEVATAACGKAVAPPPAPEAAPPPAGG